MTEYYDAANLIAHEIRSETSSKKWIDIHRCSFMDANALHNRIQDQMDVLCPTLFSLIQAHRSKKVED